MGTVEIMEARGLELALEVSKSSRKRLENLSWGDMAASSVSDCARGGDEGRERRIAGCERLDCAWGSI